MTVKEKVLKLVEQYTKKIESLKEQEKAIFETVYKLNSDVIQLGNKKYNEVVGSENINVNDISKINVKIQKVNERIKDEKETIELIKQTVRELEEKFKSDSTVLHGELYNEYLQELRAVGLDVQKIADQGTMKQIEMWDLDTEFSQLVSKMNSIGNGNLSYRLPVIEVMADSVANVFKLVPRNHVSNIKKDGIEYYNNVYGRYGRMIR